jgi:type I restriction enzyme S subunit
MIDSILGPIPEGWRVGRLGETGKQITQKVKKEENRKVLSAVSSGNLVLSEDYFTKQVFSKSLEKYIICDIGDFAYNPARINIGSIGRNKTTDGAVSPVYVVFRPNKNIGKYLEFVFKTNSFSMHVEKFANGSVRQALNYDGFSRFELLIPNEFVLEKFNQIILNLEEKINFNNSQIQTLSTLCDTLLPKLMKGEIRVKSEE